MMYRFIYNGRYNNRITNYKVWQDGYHGIECDTGKILLQKLDYIHNNPVTAAIVEEPEHYIYSSATNYAGNKGVIDVILLDIAYYIANISSF